ncbi:MAG: 4Fe-4S binding protein [Bacteroidetes bacterium]|nr:4Fe-4S binding protein [Bacteroidota bacterium]
MKEKAGIIPAVLAIILLGCTMISAGNHFSLPVESDTEQKDTLKAIDEFKPFSQEDQIKKEVEFKNSGNGKSCQPDCPQKRAVNEELRLKELYWTLGILLATVIAGFLVRFRVIRKFRNIFLLSSLIVLGFSELHHACPCMLSSFQNTVLGIFGAEADRQKMLWFLGLIPVTYFFGKVWCGWLCHLGALQEFLYLPGRFNIFRGIKAMRVMKIIRIVLVAALIIQLAIEQKIFFCKIDPFKIIFDIGIYGSHYKAVKWILLGLLLLTSLLSYRPFCKSACPVGLMLGFVSRIPGASVIGLKGECSGCKICSNACKQDAILRKEKYSRLNNEDCILCGDCIDACSRKGLGFSRKSKKHPTIALYKSDEREV